MFPFPFSFLSGAAPDVPVDRIANAKAMSFNGTDAYISSGLAVGSTDFTFSCWLKHSGSFGSNYQNIAYHSLVSTISNFTGFLMYHTTGGNLVLRALSNGTADGTTQVGAGWNHIAGVFNNTSGSLIYYLNGQPEVTTTIAQNSFNTRIIEIGKLVTGNFNSNFTAWEGDIDEYALFNTALSANKIQQIYDATAVVGGVPQTANLFTGGLDTSLVYWNRMGDS